MKKMTGIVFGFASALCLILAGMAAAGEVDCAEPVSTQQGLIKGKDDSRYSACVWKGVAYAAPPVGDLRWRAPQPPEPHEGVYEAHDYCAACPQSQTLTSGGEYDWFDEDCLYLNIWRPMKEGSYPVMYWIHGGAFKQGTGNYEMSDGARLAAEREVVLVTVDYRVGALGFLALPELREEDENGSTGNYGLMDQIQGLRWVRENIEVFGGDPDNVTIFGQSAGGMSVCALLASPPAEGLFHRAISMSGACDTGSTLDRAYEQGEKFAEEMGCSGSDRLECLRSRTPDEIVPEGQNMIVSVIAGKKSRHGPNIDGYVLPDVPLEVIRAGDFNRVPVMLGHTRDEVKLYTMVMPGISLLPKAFFNKLLKRFLGEDYLNEVMQHYSYKDYKHPSQCAFAIVDDGFIARGYVAAEALSPQTRTWLWRFDWDDTRFRNKMGAFHGLDEPMVFGALEMDSRLAKLLADKRAVELGAPLSEEIMGYYTNFAATGDPNGEGLLYWPAYTVDKKERIYFDNEVRVAPLTEEEIAKYEISADLSILDKAF